METWKHLRAILLLPGIVTVVIPAAILWNTGPDTFGLWKSAPNSRVIAPLLGCVSICAGLALMAATIRLFHLIGRGTLAPWNPTQHIVTEGVYRYVRNPMISGVFLVLIGEALATLSLPVLYWFASFAIINGVYIPLLEEPRLVEKFSDEYLTYARNVPRWIPRLTPWRGEREQED
jgi:protein-S-isoprenylcysteine O-methyltransferase Ste14